MFDPNYLIIPNKSILIFCPPRVGSSSFCELLKKYNPDHINYDELFGEAYPQIFDQNMLKKLCIIKIINDHKIPAYLDIVNTFNISLERKDQIAQIYSWYKFISLDPNNLEIKTDLLEQSILYIKEMSKKRKNIKIDLELFYEDITHLFGPLGRSVRYGDYNEICQLIKEKIE